MMRVLREMQEEFPCYLVRGNREEYLLENLRHPQNWKAGSSTSGLLDYTFRNLTGQDLEFFEQLPTDGVLIGKMHESGRLIPVFVPQEEIIPDTCRESLFPALRLCHGAPGELRGNFGLHPELLLSHLENLDAAILLGGHSHKQEQREYAGKTYLNPGSLGNALDGVGGHAHFRDSDAGKQHMADRMFSDSLRSRRLPRRIRPRRAGNAWQCPCPFLKTDIDLRRELFLSHRKTSVNSPMLALTDLDEVWKKAEQELK